MAPTNPRLFCHINDFRFEGWPLLRLMLIMGERVTLWSPAARLIERARRDGAIDFGFPELLNLVRSGHIRVIGREWWFADRTQRNAMTWEDGHWEEDFDKEILKIAEADVGMPDARVTIAPDQRGYKWADAEIARDSESARLAKTLVKLRKLPKPILRRIDNLGSGTSLSEAAREPLRDAINHDNALQFSGADIAVETSEYSDSLPRLSGRKPLDLSAIAPDVDPEIFERTIDLVRYLARPRPIEEIAELRDTEAIISVRRGIFQLFNAELSPTADLHEKINNGIRQVKDLDKYLGRTSIEKGITMTGALCALLSLASLKSGGPKIDRRRFIGLLGAAGSAAVVGVPSALELASDNSLLPYRRYEGPAWPFLLLYGKDDPSRREIEGLVSSLDERLRMGLF